MSSQARHNEPPDSGSRPGALKTLASFGLTFGLMMSTWIVLSGKFDPMLLGLGGVSSFLVAFFFHDLLFSSMTRVHILVLYRFTRYLPWLILQIVKANFHLLSIVFHPRMNELIDPHIITFRTRLKSDIAITTLANSITLTPGTITVSANADGEFRVHAIDRESAEALPGEMLKKVSWVFGEPL